MRPRIAGGLPALLVVAAAFGALGALVATGCAGPGSYGVRTDFDPDVDFSRYVTYDWLEPPLTLGATLSAGAGESHPFEGNTLVDKRVRRAVDDELEARGYRRAGDASPDFRVRYRVSFEERADESDTRRRTRRFDQGLLFVDVIDAKSQRMSWSGWAHGRDHEGYFTDDQLRRSVARVLRSFPPPGVEPPGEKELLLRRVEQLEEQLRRQQEAQEAQKEIQPAPAATERPAARRSLSEEWRD